MSGNESVLDRATKIIARMIDDAPRDPNPREVAAALALAGLLVWEPPTLRVPGVDTRVFEDGKVIGGDLGVTP